MKQQSYRITNDMVAYNAASAIKILPHDGKWEVVIREHKSSRSLAQNRLYWKWNSELSSETGISKQAAHLQFKWRFARPLLIRDDETGGIEALYERVKDHPAMQKALTNLLSTRDLSTAQMAEALTDYDLWAANSGGVQFSHPEDLYFEAIA